ELVEQMARTRAVDAASATALLPLLPPEPRQRMSAVLQRLRRALLEARAVERQNRVLVSGGLDTVSEILAALRALVPGARYGADAQITSAPPTDAVDRHV